MEDKDELDENGQNKIFSLWLSEDEGETKTPMSGAVKLKKSNLDNNEKIKEMQIQIDIPTFSSRSGEGSDRIFYWEDIYFTIMSNLGSTFDCQFMDSS